MPWRRPFIRLIGNNDGVTAIEYGLIAVAAVVVMGMVGTNLGSTLDTIAANLGGATPHRATNTN
jgi:Flp pilus assembly pilin Flp